MCCMRNVEQTDGSIDYRLLEIGMSGSYESTSSYASDTDYFYSFSFPRNS